MTTRDPRRDEDDIEATLREASEIARGQTPDRELLARLIARVEYLVRRVEALHADVAELKGAQSEHSLYFGSVMAELGYLRAVIGEEPDLAARPPRAGSGLALRVYYLWGDFVGRVGKPAVGAAVGGGAVYGLIEIAKAILEAVR